MTLTSKDDLLVGTSGDFLQFVAPIKEKYFVVLKLCLEILGEYDEEIICIIKKEITENVFFARNKSFSEGKTLM